MFDHRGDEPNAALAPTGQRLAASLTQLAEVTGVLASVSFAEVSEQSVKDASVALDGCRNRLDAVFASGELGAAKAQLLAGAAKHAPDAFVDDESGLLAKAKGLRVDQTKVMLEFWKAHANPDYAQDEHECQFQARSVFLSQTMDGMWRLDGLLTPEMGEILATELERRTRALYKSDKAVSDANGTQIERSTPQRRADALLDLALQSQTNGDGGSINLPAITAVIRVDQITDPDTKPGDPVGQTEHGHPVTKATAERLLCDCARSHPMQRVSLPSQAAGPVGPHGRPDGRTDGRTLHRGPSAQSDKSHRMQSDRRFTRPG